MTLDDTWHRLMGYEPGEITDPMATWLGTLHPDDAPKVRAILDRHLVSDDARYDIDYRARKKDGTWTWINTRGRVQSRDASGRALRMMGTIQDVSARKGLEQTTLDSLHEKEILLREIHHRVKNNLAVMSSLFYFQANEATDPAVVRVFQDSQDRTRSMAMVHELLYRSTNLSCIDFGEYLQRLVGHLHGTHGMSSAPVLDLDPVELSVDAAVPCGLIINELLTNAFKHAYVDRAPGRVCVSLRQRDHHVQIAVADDGVGMPPGTDPATSRSLGLRLVRSLADQLDGTITFRALQPGTEARLEFPLPRPPDGSLDDPVVDAAPRARS